MASGADNRILRLPCEVEQVSSARNEEGEMNTLEAIAGRRSMRRFKDQAVPLAAHELGLGTLWICDVFYAYDGLREWLGRKDQMVAAVSIGYADEAPEARPRKPWQEVTEWMGE